MDSLSFFDEFIKVRMPIGCCLSWNFFKNGDFGDLSRLEFDFNKKIGSIDFWSTGWVGIDIIDAEINEQILNSLYSPDQERDIQISLERLIEVLSK